MEVLWYLSVFFMIITGITWISIEVFASLEGEALDAAVEELAEHEFNEGFIRWMHLVVEISLDLLRPYFIIGLIPYVNIAFYMTISITKRLPPFL